VTFNLQGYTHDLASSNINLPAMQLPVQCAQSAPSQITHFLRVRKNKVNYSALHLGHKIQQAKMNGAYAVLDLDPTLLDSNFIEPNKLQLLFRPSGKHTDSTHFIHARVPFNFSQLLATPQKTFEQYHNYIKQWPESFRTSDPNKPYNRWNGNSCAVKITFFVLV
jgi:hypothetical protein